MNFVNQQLNVSLMQNGTRRPVHHTAELPSSSMEQLEMLEIRPDIETNDHLMPWNMQMAFNATTGACVYRGKYTTSENMTTLEPKTLEFLATTEPATLTPVQIAASQHPGPSSFIVKALTCIQAVWFCSQCIARMSSDMAISLLELNTFAHCISALFIYGFWWQKPYDVTSYASMQSDTLDFLFLARTAVEDSQWSEHPTYNRSYATVRLYVSLDRGSRVRLAEFNLEEVDFTYRAHRENSRFIKVTETEFIAGSKFFFLVKTSSSAERRSFLLPKHSLIHWQRLWRFSVGTPFAITSAYKNLAQAQFATRSRNIKGGFLTGPLAPFAFNDGDSLLSKFSKLASMNVAFILYGGLHLLAWHYHFRSTAETILWKTAGIVTASSGAVAVVLIPSWTRSHGVMIPIVCLLCAWILLNIAARIFLFVESFVALPNSPQSTYLVPLWTAYVPHL
jgi:hypothetical protein